MYSFTEQYLPTLDQKQQGDSFLNRQTQIIIFQTQEELLILSKDMNLHLESIQSIIIEHQNANDIQKLQSANDRITHVISMILRTQNNFHEKKLNLLRLRDSKNEIPISNNLQTYNNNNNNNNLKQNSSYVSYNTQNISNYQQPLITVNQQIGQINHNNQIIESKQGDSTHNFSSQKIFNQIPINQNYFQGQTGGVVVGGDQSENQKLQQINKIQNLQKQLSITQHSLNDNQNNYSQLNKPFDIIQNEQNGKIFNQISNNNNQFLDLPRLNTNKSNSNIQFQQPNQIQPQIYQQPEKQQQFLYLEKLNNVNNKNNQNIESPILPQSQSANASKQILPIQNYNINRQFERNHQEIQNKVIQSNCLDDNLSHSNFSTRAGTYQDLTQSISTHSMMSNQLNSSHNIKSTPQNVFEPTKFTLKDDLNNQSHTFQTPQKQQQLLFNVKQESDNNSVQDKSFIQQNLNNHSDENIDPKQNNNNNNNNNFSNDEEINNYNIIKKRKCNGGNTLQIIQEENKIINSNSQLLNNNQNENEQKQLNTVNSSNITSIQQNQISNNNNTILIKNQNSIGDLINILDTLKHSSSNHTVTIEKPLKNKKLDQSNNISQNDESNGDTQSELSKQEEIQEINKNKNKTKKYKREFDSRNVIKNVFKLLISYLRNIKFTGQEWVNVEKDFQVYLDKYKQKKGKGDNVQNSRSFFQNYPIVNQLSEIQNEMLLQDLQLRLVDFPSSSQLPLNEIIKRINYFNSLIRRHSMIYLKFEIHQVIERNPSFIQKESIHKFAQLLQGYIKEPSTYLRIQC